MLCQMAGPNPALPDHGVRRMLTIVPTAYEKLGSVMRDRVSCRSNSSRCSQLTAMDTLGRCTQRRLARFSWVASSRLPCPRSSRPRMQRTDRALRVWCVLQAASCALRAANAAAKRSNRQCSVGSRVNCTVKAVVGMPKGLSRDLHHGRLPCFRSDRGRAAVPPSHRCRPLQSPRGSHRTSPRGATRSRSAGSMYCCRFGTVFLKGSA